MKSLYESIIGSNSAGIKARIKEWCDAHNIYNGNYVIGKDGKIYKGTNNLVGSYLWLDYGDYDELPEYISFGHCDRATLVIGQRSGKGYSSFEPLPFIKSFRGVPEEAFAVLIRPMKNIIVPKLDIKTPKFTLLCNHLTKGTEQINVDTSDNRRSRISLHPDSYSGFNYNLNVKGTVNELFFRDDSMEEEFAKLIRGKAPMNKKVPRPDDQPLTDEAQNIVNSFFISHGINIDMKKLDKIDYVQASTLNKGKDGLWYRRPSGY